MEGGWSASRPVRRRMAPTRAVPDPSKTPTDGTDAAHPLWTPHQKAPNALGEVLALRAHCVHTAHAEAGILTQVIRLVVTVLFPRNPFQKMNNPKIFDYLWKHFSFIGNQGHRINHQKVARVRVFADIQNFALRAHWVHGIPLHTLCGSSPRGPAQPSGPSAPAQKRVGNRLREQTHTSATHEKPHFVIPLARSGLYARQHSTHNVLRRPTKTRVPPSPSHFAPPPPPPPPEAEWQSSVG